MGWLDGDMEEQKRSEKTESIDPRMQGYFYGAANNLQNAFNRPLDQKFAGPNRNMTRAWSGLANLKDPREYALASSAMQGATFDPNSYKAFMSPYQQEVTDRAIQALNEQARTNMALSGLTSAQSGGYGGSGNAIMNATTARALQRDVGDTQAKGSQDAFTLANQLALRRAGLNLERGQGLQSLAGDRQRANIERLKAMYMAGASQREIEQARKDLERNDAVRYAQAMAGLPYTKSSTDTEYARSPSAMSQLTGLLGSAASLYMGLPGTLGGGSLGGAFKNATDWWTGGGGGFMNEQNQGFW